MASAFRDLKINRHSADYDLADELSAADVGTDLLAAERAIKIWPSIRDEQIAQDYLFSLLFKDRV